MAMTFDSTSSHALDYGDPSTLRDLDPLTITAWIRPTGWGGASYGRIIVKEDYDGTYWGWLFFLRNVSPTFATIEFGRYRATIDTNVRAVGSSISLNTWQHVAVTYTSSGSELYKNGSQLSLAVDVAGSGSIMSDYTEDGFIANTKGGARGFTGQIEDVRLYERELSQEEISTIYTAKGHDGIVEDLRARWLMREKAPGTTVSTDNVYDITDYKHEADPDDTSIEYAEGIISPRRLP